MCIYTSMKTYSEVIKTHEVVFKIVFLHKKEVKFPQNAAKMTAKKQFY